MRTSGILMHITSLPGPYGIGTMGKSAYEFVDFLEKSGQSFWQILPLNPTGYGDSPYQSFSSHAGNPYLIDLEKLIEEGLLQREEVDSFFWGESAKKVDFGAIYENRLKALNIAFSRFEANWDYNEFCEKNKTWLDSFCLFVALKEDLGGTWRQWDQPIMLYEESALQKERERLSSKIEFYKFLQYKFFEQWRALRSYANNKGISIIGDVPIYVPLDSADVWANHSLFQLDENCKPLAVAGCPPDGFSADGQLWGNPLYDWEALKQTGYDWWLKRLASAADMYDVVRIDHFRGFESYWSVPADDDNARGGKWVEGPAEEFTNVIKEVFPNLKFIAEDLGFITPGVKRLCESFGHPGMKVIQFAFDSREESDYLPHLYPKNSVCYTGTHDNPPLKQWLNDVNPSDLEYAKEYLGLNSEEGYIWGILRGCMSSVSNLFVAQMQDYLETEEQARMNTPGLLSSDNWTWRATEGYISDSLAERIFRITKRYGRLKK